MSDKDIPMRLVLEGGDAWSVQRYRTSSTEDMAQLPDIPLDKDGSINDVLPAGSMTTWIIDSKQTKQ